MFVDIDILLYVVLKTIYVVGCERAKLKFLRLQYLFLEIYWSWTLVLFGFTLFPVCRDEVSQKGINFRTRTESNWLTLNQF